MNIFIHLTCFMSAYYVPGIVLMIAAAAAAKSLQLCPTLCDPIDGSLPGSPVPGILQARTLEWVAISFYNAWKVKVKSLSHVRLCETPWTAARQACPSMGFPRHEYWSGMPLPSPESFFFNLMFWIGASSFYSHFKHCQRTCLPFKKVCMLA